MHVIVRNYHMLFVDFVRAGFVTDISILVKLSLLALSFTHKSSIEIKSEFVSILTTARHRKFINGFLYNSIELK